LLKQPVLGEFRYKLRLRGLAPTTQRSLNFQTSLGSELVQAFKFTHFLKQKQTNYAAKIFKVDQAEAATEFKAEPAQVQAPPADSFKGTEVSVNIKFEPFTIGESRGILKLTSPEGMEYTCLLYGKSTAPQPQVSRH